MIMGMFDDLYIDKKHLPDELKDYEFGWKTKSHHRLLNLLKIDENGNLLLVDVDEYGNHGETEKLNYTGEIRFYQNINSIWYEFVAFFVKGEMLKIIKLEENE